MFLYFSLITTSLTLKKKSISIVEFVWEVRSDTKLLVFIGQGISFTYSQTNRKF